MIRVRPRLANRHPKAFAQAVRQWPLRARALVVGDSWFRYDKLAPLSLLGNLTGGTGNLFHALQRHLQFVSLSMSGNGNTLHDMLSDKGLRKIRDTLTKSGPFTYLFFSGGGNDVVNHLAGYVNPKGHEIGPLRTYVLESALYSMRLRLQALCELRDLYHPGTQILVHNYGAPSLSTGGFRRFGIEFAGPWIMPKLEAKGYDIEESEQILAAIMHRFNRMLHQVDGYMSVVDTASELRPEYWRDEMHLTPAGYTAAAAAYLPHLQRSDARWH